MEVGSLNKRILYSLISNIYTPVKGNWEMNFTTISNSRYSRLFYLKNNRFKIMKNKIFFLSIFIVFFSSITYCVNNESTKISPELLHQQWPAYWIEVPGEPHHSYGVYLFRKEFNLNQIPSAFIINVSADNRYKLYVNGELVSLGPARGDEIHWRFETVDISIFIFRKKCYCCDCMERW